MSHHSLYLRGVAFFLAAGAIATAASCASTKTETHPEVGQAGHTEITVEGPGKAGKQDTSQTTVTAEAHSDKEIVSGNLTSAMTEQDAIGFIKKDQEKFDECYEQEALNGKIERTAFVFEVAIPQAGGDHRATLRHRTDPEKYALEHCITEAMEAVKFPGHRGDPLIMQVRIQGSVPVQAGAPIAMIQSETDAVRAEAE